ncbi:MAG: hypothetical protein KAR40_02995 [Candidatus Sabulitectum sp.]|nr:hypothetical protein [Candidatus Sabulitectum sp.]
MTKIHSILIAVSVLLISVACADKPVDVLVAADGTVLTGELQTIEYGKAVFAGGTIDVPDHGLVWCLDGSTFAGEITASGGVFRSDSCSVPEDSVLMIVWGNSDVHQETFTVDASLGWQDTGILLEQGEIFSLRGTGTVVTETGTATPQGQEKFSSSVSLVPGATSGQLVFQVGEGGQPVAAGCSWVGESPDAGTLLLAVNVPLEGSSGSRGVYTVTVNAGSSGNRAGTVVFYPAGR